MLAPLLLLTPALLAEPDLVLRGTRPPPDQPIRAVDLDGVLVGDEPGVIVGWDLVAALPAAWVEPARPWKDLAEDLWRARVRLERGDFSLAERTLEPWLPRVRGRTGPAAMLVGDGLLRCRLRRGARAGAVEAWMVWLGAREPAGAAYLDSGRPAPSIVADPAAVPDADLGLVPDLPPMWLDIPAVRALGESPAPEGDAHWAFMARAYGASAAAECGLKAGLDGLDAVLTGSDPAADDHRAVARRLVSAIVLSRAGDDRQRESARAALAALSVLDERPWVEAWRRAAIGRSLLRESERERRLEGVLEMLHVPARLAEASPYLTGLVLAEAAVALRDLGDSAGADRLFQEFASLGTSHPAWQWGPIRTWGRPGPVNEPSPPAPGAVPPDVPSDAAPHAPETGVSPP